MKTIAELLGSECPRTDEGFKARFGEPRMDMGGDAAREYCVWNVDGSPVVDIDYLMLYGNIVRHQVLYVYAKAGRVTHVAVVDPTEWRRSDFKSHSRPAQLSRD